jgi:2-polyprenyl-6-methoxyphenol hydroxylase-like FAD-dependent oxidoreductase
VRLLRTSVAIVGGGPVGMVLALMLDRLGVDAVIFNTQQTSLWHPRGSTHNSRTMEHYRTLGLSRQLRQLGLPPHHPRDIWYLTRLNGYELARLPMGSERERGERAAAADATEQIVEPLLRANQMYVEHFLFEQLPKHKNVTLRFGWEVNDLQEAENCVTLAAGSGDGSSEEWTADYVVGCDGGQSFVRRTLGISYGGGAVDRSAFMAGKMIAAHVRIQRIHQEILRGREGWLYNIVNPEFRMLLFSLDGGDDFLMMLKAVDGLAFDDAFLAQRLQSAIGAALPVTIVGQQPWTGGVALVADSYGRGRTFLAGDSIHLFSPTGGLGMNTGIDDVANLAWKLAASVQGWGGDSLLSTYELERRAVALRNTSVARNHTQRIGEMAVPAAVEDSTEKGAAARSELAGLLKSFFAQYNAPGVELGARYDGSPIIVPNGAPPSDDAVVYTPSSVPGGRLPHLWIDPPGAGRRSIFDQLGAGFTLVRVGEVDANAEAFREAGRELGVPVKVLDLPSKPAMDLYQTRLMLVRPDQHIAWRGDEPPSDWHNVLCIVIGREGIGRSKRSLAVASSS